jgi:hypothetical protein
MSRKDDCWDNATMESFFHTVKTERVHHRVYTTPAKARRDLFGYIEGFQIPAACIQLWAIASSPSWSLSTAPIGPYRRGASTTSGAPRRPAWCGWGLVRTGSKRCSTIVRG